MTHYGWDWTNRGVRLCRDGRELVEIGTRYPSRDGLRLVDAAGKGTADRGQATDHGCGRKSVQLFQRTTLVADVPVN